MAYQALYRKWRPADFDGVKGQDHIVTALRNQIQMNRVGHAYLFCGTRGTGKTSVARIFAKAVNCEHPVNGNPCNKCAMCRAVDEQRSVNVIEIDGATNRGIDNIREIREDAAYLPTEGRYKVYIIDEAHMVTNEAFNAFLKTLEEPPAHVIFILATTEPNRIPQTILSRCQRYDFRRISTPMIADRLRELTDAESMEAEDAALVYIARTADGSMRDAIGLLEQCQAFYAGKKLRYEDVLDVLGAVDTGVFAQITGYIVDRNAAGLMRTVDEVMIQGRELTQFVTDYTWYLRNLMLVKSSDDLGDMIDASPEQLEEMKALAGRMDFNEITRYIRIFSELSSDMRYSSQKRVLVEVALIKLCRPEMESDNEAILNRLSVLERKAESQAFVPAADGRPSAGDSISALAEDVPAQEGRAGGLQKALSEDVREVIGKWPQILEDLEIPAQEMLREARISEGSSGQIVIGFSDELKYGYYCKENHQKALEEALSGRMNKVFEIEYVLMENKTAEDGFIDPLSVFSGVETGYEDE